MRRIPDLKVFEKLKSLGTPCLIVFGKDFNHRLFNLASLNVNFNRVGSGKNAALPMVNGGFEYFELDDNQRSIVNKWPPLSTPFGKIKGFKNTDMVLMQKIGAIATEEPLLAVTSENNYRFGVLAGTGIWQWRLADFEKNNNHQTSEMLVNKVVQYLSVKQEKKLLKVNQLPQCFNLGDEVKLIGELYNQSLEPITNQEINVELIHPDNSKTKHNMAAEGLGYKLSLKNYAEGSYTFRATSTVGGENPC